MTGKKGKVAPPLSAVESREAATTIAASWPATGLVSGAVIQRSPDPEPARPRLTGCAAPDGDAAGPQCDRACGLCRIDEEYDRLTEGTAP
jgi:hypothetical protein